MIYGIYTKQEYSQVIQDQTDPQLNKLWGILDLILAAQEQERITVLFPTGQVVPLKVVTWITSNLQFQVIADNLPNGMRKINEIKLT